MERAEGRRGGKLREVKEDAWRKREAGKRTMFGAGGREEGRKVGGKLRKMEAEGGREENNGWSVRKGGGMKVEGY